MNVKNPVAVVGVVLLLFFLVTQPVVLAGIVLSILSILEGFGNSIVSFMGALF